MISSEVAAAIAAELSDERYATRTHGVRSGVNAGCKGPLCLKFTRDRLRAAYQAANPSAQRTRRGPADPELDKFLDDIIEAHVKQRLLIRAS